ncbi:hypothetical protein [Nocardia lasii]|uniref:FUSC family protein n=1 Tax=Nocardia lasii TaxID=1616107 RepID=A0ABW1JYA1_9NOCA
MNQGRNDIRDVLGLRTAQAKLLAGFFTVTILSMVALSYEGLSTVWLSVLGALIILTAGLCIIAAPGDPLPTRWAMLLAGAAPVGTALAITQLPVPIVNTTQLWFIGATSAYLNFLCVRGAAVWAWAATLTTMGVCAWWFARTGQGISTGVITAAVNVAPLAMATVFARTVRPVAHTILDLRDRTTQQTAMAAATTAAQRERDLRLAHLDSAARPLLTAIASGRPLTPAEQAECRLIEAELRDSILGGCLVDDAVNAAARRARHRGITVTLDDGGALDSADPTLIHRVRHHLCQALDTMTTGEITARVLPTGRDHLVAILIRGPVEHRILVDTTGTFTTIPPTLTHPAESPRSVGSPV